MIPGNTSSQGKYVDPPTSVSASAGNAQATVTFTLPVYDGKGTATYVATASPGGATASGASSPLVVTGLSNGTSYTFTVSTISGYGVSATSTASSAVTPVAPPPSFGPSFPSFPSFEPSFPSFPSFPTFPEFPPACTDCNETSVSLIQCPSNGSSGCITYRHYYNPLPAGCVGCPPYADEPCFTAFPPGC